MVLSPRENLASSGDIFDGHNIFDGVTSSKWEKIRDAKYPIMNSLNANSTEAEKAWIK